MKRMFGLSYVRTVVTLVQSVENGVEQSAFQLLYGIIGIRGRFFATDAATRHALRLLVRHAMYAEILVVTTNIARVVWYHSHQLTTPKVKRMLMDFYASIVVINVAFVEKEKTKTAFRNLRLNTSMNGRWSARNVATHDALPQIVHGVLSVAIYTAASACVTKP